MHPPERIPPGPGQESVWDYPRPPRWEPCTSQVRVEHAGLTVAESTATIRVLETSQPPAFYIPPADVAMHLLRPGSRRTYCEWKGEAHYVDLVLDDLVVEDVGWFYPAPVARFAPIAGHLAFYPQRVHACFVDGEQVQANEGSFYGGWITSKVVGPFKGGPGTGGW